MYIDVSVRVAKGLCVQHLCDVSCQLSENIDPQRLSNVSIGLSGIQASMTIFEFLCPVFVDMCTFPRGRGKRMIF